MQECDTCTGGPGANIRLALAAGNVPQPLLAASPELRQGVIISEQALGTFNFRFSWVLTVQVQMQAHQQQLSNRIGLGSDSETNQLGAMNVPSAIREAQCATSPVCERRCYIEREHLVRKGMLADN